MTDLVPALGTTLLHFLWQGTLVGIAAWAALLLLRNARPQARYLVACLALLACVALPAWTLAQAWPDAEAATSPHVATAIAGTPGTLATTAGLPSPLAAIAGDDAARLPWLVLAWAAGVSALGLRMLLGLAWIHRLRRHARVPVDAALRARFDALVERFGLRRMVQLRLLADGDTPLAIGWWTPVVLLPAAIAARMPLPLLEALLAHELAHIRRHDYLVNLLQGMVEALLFYHPVVWWLSHRIRIEREQVADRLAADVLDDPRRIALALAELDRFGCTPSAPHPPVLAQAAHGGQLMQRIRQLIRPEHRLVGGTLALPLVGSVAMGLAFQASAQLGPESRPATATTLAPPAPPAPPAALDDNPPPAPPAPPAALDARALPAPPAPPAPAIAPPPPPAHRGRVDGDGYALVRAGRGDFTMTSSSDDIDDVRELQQRLDGDFLWFRREGRDYVVRDPALIARAGAAWRDMTPDQARMRELGARMQPHERTLAALGARISPPTPAFAQNPKVREAQRQIEMITSRQSAIAQQQAALTLSMLSADESGRAELSRELEGLSAQQQDLSRLIEEQARMLETQTRNVQIAHARIDAVAREMQATSVPMQAIGREMGAVGERIAHQAIAVDREVRALIEESVQRGLATPASILR